MSETPRPFSRLDQLDEFLSSALAVSYRNGSAAPRWFLLGLPFAYGQFFLRGPAHLDQRIDEIVDGFMFFCLAPHPHERVEQIVNRFALFFGHAALYPVPMSFRRHKPRAARGPLVRPPRRQLGRQNVNVNRASTLSMLGPAGTP